MSSIKQQIEFISNNWKNVILSYPNINTLCEEVKTIYDNQDIIVEDEVTLKVFPKRENIFRCFQYVSPENIKVIIIGQDPYHGEGQATGLCFGVNKECKMPPSLKNIEKELKSDINVELNDSTLEKWATQGVLLVNTALTVREHCPNSHSKIWSDFTEYILQYLNEKTENKIFVTWGAFAYNRLFNKNFELNMERHTLIASSHPSPLGARRQFKTYPAFIGSKPFSKINNNLIKQEKQPIEW